MFGVSLPELIVIFVVVLIVFGPDKLPEIARSFGKWTGELRRTSDSLRREFYHSVYNPADEMRREVSKLKTELVAFKPSESPLPKNEPPTTEAAGEKGTPSAEPNEPKGSPS